MKYKHGIFWFWGAVEFYEAKKIPKWYGVANYDVVCRRLLFVLIPFNVPISLILKLYYSLGRLCKQGVRNKLHHVYDLGFQDGRAAKSNADLNEFITKMIKIVGK